MRVTVSRKAHFNAAHRLYRKDWTMEKNQEVFEANQEVFWVFRGTLKAIQSMDLRSLFTQNNEKKAGVNYLILKKDISVGPYVFIEIMGQ